MYIHTLTLSSISSHLLFNPALTTKLLTITAVND